MRQSRRGTKGFDPKVPKVFNDLKVLKVLKDSKDPKDLNRDRPRPQNITGTVETVKNNNNNE